MSEEIIIESQLVRLNLELLRYVMHFVGHDPIQPLKEVNKYFNEKIKLFEKCKKYKSYYYEDKRYNYFLNPNIFNYACDRNMICFKIHDCFFNTFKIHKVPNNMMIYVLELIKKDINLQDFDLTYMFYLRYSEFINEMALRENFEILHYCYLQEWNNISVHKKQFGIDVNFIQKNERKSIEYPISHDLLFYIARSNKMDFVLKCIDLFKELNTRYLLLGAIFYNNTKLIHYCREILKIEKTHEELRCAIFTGNIDEIKYNYDESLFIKHDYMRDVIVIDNLEHFLYFCDKLKDKIPIFVKENQEINDYDLYSNENTFFQKYIILILECNAYKILIYFMENYFHELRNEIKNNLLLLFLKYYSFNYIEEGIQIRNVEYNKLSNKIMYLFTLYLKKPINIKAKLKDKLINLVFDFQDQTLLDLLIKHEYINEHELFIISSLSILKIEHMNATIKDKINHIFSFNHDIEKEMVLLSNNNNLIPYQDVIKMKREHIFDLEKIQRKDVEEFTLYIFNKYKSKFTKCIDSTNSFKSNTYCINKKCNCIIFLLNLNALERSEQHCYFTKDYFIHFIE